MAGFLPLRSDLLSGVPSLMTRVLQISDTHVGFAKRHFLDNWRKVQAWADSQDADLLIHTGDVTLDGAGDARDIPYCAELLQGLDVPWQSVPGNHDVGDPDSLAQPVNDARLAAWGEGFGTGNWIMDLEEWRLLGLNSMLIGSGRSEEAAQLAWLKDSMAGAGTRRIGWFLHRPLFIHEPEDPDMGYWAAKPEPRQAYMDLIGRHDVGLVASGHLHKSHDFELDGVRYVWAPSTAFALRPDQQPGMPGESRLGAVVYEFAGRELSVARVDVPELQMFWIDDVLHEIYPGSSVS
ncbi:metallophosphoesterase family protein [Geminicoccus harenae]|uniref:metallophosphoesterase family protein n=1 Tax=Geminicoccus harenae TaxID=2498453 RepID=UPI00168B277A|nr:metallophosphoesterase [Geminicoccus harenae]